MKILLTGATGYIGKRILPELLGKGHNVVCCVRDKKRFSYPESFKDKIEVIEVDFLDRSTLNNIPDDIDGAYYLIHSMSSSDNYEKPEMESAINFREKLNTTNVKHVIYLSGIVNEEHLSKHLASRKAVELELQKGKYNFTALRAGIIIGSGSASFEIIRDLAEKLPFMIAPKWLNTKCQPIGIADVVSFLIETLFNSKTFNQNFDIGGPDILTYKQMLLGYAKARKLKRHILIVPVMTPKLSSYWLYFVTSTSFRLASALVSSMKIEVICRNNDLNRILNINPSGYQTSLENAFSKINNNHIISSWKDSYISGSLNRNISEFIEVPIHGCFIDNKIISVSDIDSCIEKIWSIGGENGWYYANWLWRIRGILDKFAGGVGLRRGRTNTTEIYTGDALDFWRVLYADKDEKRLLLYAEMKLPGEAWLEFAIKNNNLCQTATFRPKGLSGRFYWYLSFPFHFFIFNGLVKHLVK